MLIAGNWKMNLSRGQSVELARALAEHVARGPARPAELVVCPPYVYLDAVRQTLEGSPISLGAQNLYHEPNGAFTGEISASMLVDLGCRYVILGHSERRHILGESNDAVNRKVHAALAANLTPIVCVGETLAEREANRTFAVVESQCAGSLAGLSTGQVAQLVIAYEPVWAIGTGKVATQEQAEEVHQELRRLLATRYNSDVAEAVRILYGGSVKADNASGLLSQANIDGALVGGASLAAESFLGIVPG